MTPHDCNVEKVYQFADGELAERQKEAVQDHLDQCAHCRGILHHSRQLTALYQQFSRTRASRSSRASVATGPLGRVRPDKRPWRRRLQAYFPKWVTVPLVTALLLMVLAFPWLLKKNVKEPSAIITSLTSDSGSIMMFETPVSKQTVIWVAENSQ